MRWRRAIVLALVTPVLFVVTCSGIMRGSFASWKADRTLAVGAAVPDAFPVLAFWTGEDGPHCRVLLHGELEAARRELNGLKLAVPAEETGTCESSFDEASRHGAWGDPLEWASSRVWRVSFEIEPLDSTRFAVTVDYRPDDDRVIRGEYETDGRSLEDARYLDYFGPAPVLDLLPHSVGATALLFALVGATLLLLARHRRV